MKLKKNVALIMIAAAMLAGGYAQADNPPPTPQGDTASHRPVGGGTTEQINDPTGTGARAATTIKENLMKKEDLSKDGQRGGIFSKKDKSRGYQKAWAQQGCTEEAWVELNNQYDKSINMSVDQSAVTDQKIMDVIQNPNQMNINGFSMLGCNLNDSLKTIQSITNKVREFIEAIGSGNPLDKVKVELEKKARELIQGIAQKVEKKVNNGVCKLINGIASQADEFVKDQSKGDLIDLGKKKNDLQEQATQLANEGLNKIEPQSGNSGN